ncbi:WYL domain-containing protein [Streptomyces lydicus]|uniref:WYL domain-containing protein n=1 Tax=Streptomyces lydicus TaxID=47763 RepID=UPI0037A45D3E
MRHTRRTIRAALTNTHALAAAACGRLGLLRFTLETARRVRIAYTNAAGESSVRDIEPRFVKPNKKTGRLYVHAYDNLRGESRNFTLDRIALEAA